MPLDGVRRIDGQFHQATTPAATRGVSINILTLMKTFPSSAWKGLLAGGTFAVSTFIALGDQTPQELPLAQSWSATNLISSDNDWSAVPGFEGYRGDKLVSKVGSNPQLIAEPGLNTPMDVIANRGNPNTLRKGGVAEFDGVSNPIIALKGSATASAPFLLLTLKTIGKQNIVVAYNLRDIDGSSADAVQPVAFQYRIGTNDNFSNLSAAFVADASTGPNLATHVSPVILTLPPEVNDQPLIQIRWITANAEGNDEWVGIDDISVIGDDLTVPAESAVATKTNRVVKPLRSPRDSSN